MSGDMNCTMPAMNPGFFSHSLFNTDAGAGRIKIIFSCVYPMPSQFQDPGKSCLQEDTNKRKYSGHLY